MLIGYDGYAKLTDFGLSKETLTDSESYSICGTLEFLAPEVYQETGYGLAADMWSFGCLLYEMLVGLPPFYCKTRDVLKVAILTKEPKWKHHLSDSAKDLL